MLPIALPQLGVLAVGGIVVGLILLWRGSGDYRSASRIADTSSSRVSSLAAGEVRVTGAVEPAEITLVSPLQSVPCVWYRAKVTRATNDSEQTVFEEERGVGFRLQDPTGSIRVFPRGAALDVPNRYDERSGLFGEEPIGLVARQGSAFGPGAVMTPADRAAQITALLTVHPVGSMSSGDTDGDEAFTSFGRTGLGALGFGTSGRMRYQEARIEPGDAVTVLGMAMPFGELPDPLGRGPARRRGRPAVGQRSGGRARPRRGSRGRHARGPGGRLGQRRDPGLRHRAAGDRARAGSGRPCPGARDTRRGGDGEAGVRPRAAPARPRVGAGAAPDRRRGDTRPGRRPVRAAVPARAAGRGPGHRVGDRSRVLDRAEASGDAVRRRGDLRPGAPARGPRASSSISTYNAVVALRNRIDKAWANIEVVLKQRHDQLPNLVDAVRGVMAYERDVLEEVTRSARRLRPPPTRSRTRRPRARRRAAAVRQLFAVVERYPELKSAEQRAGPPGRDRAARER